MTALESAFTESDKYAQPAAVMDALEPSVVWNLANAHVADKVAPSLTTTALADNHGVDYFGDATSYSIATVSASGNEFGSFNDRSAGGGTTLIKVKDGVATLGW